jgi:hypothetical protein
MDPAVPFSLAHFWKASTFQQVDLSYHAFAPIVMADPRHAVPTHDDRTVFVEAVIAEVDRVTEPKPDWKLFSAVIIYCPPMGDLFGGGAFRTPDDNYLPAAVFDEAARFDQVCQEVGHAFGLDHELVLANGVDQEYGCPYSVMSAAGDYWFDRGLIGDLPGTVPPHAHPQRIVGPYVPAAHLYVNAYRPVDPNGFFKQPGSVIEVPATYTTKPTGLTLVARDVAVGAWPARRPVLGVVNDGLTWYFLELRRKAAGYEDGIPAAVVTVLSAQFSGGAWGRLHFLGQLDLQAGAGDLDYHSFKSHFVVRVLSSEPDFSEVSLIVAGGDSWKNFAVGFAPPNVKKTEVSTSEWQTVLTTPCPAFPKKEYSYRTHTNTVFQVWQAQSYGYESPSYRWYLGNVWLDPAVPALRRLDVVCRDVNGSEYGAPQLRTIDVVAVATGSRLDLAVGAPYADIDLPIRVEVNETSREVMRNLYPVSSATISAAIDNLEIEWDEAYQQAQWNCWKKYISDKAKVVIPFEPRRPRRDRRPQYVDITPERLVRDLMYRDPRIAIEVANEIARATDLPVPTVIADALER